MTDKKNPVIFAGAGPGDPDLITVKGQQALGNADLIIYAGSLVPEALLKWKRPEARAENSASMDLEEIVEMIRSAHGAGQKVVRLHTGDPSLYGAIFEQMRELERHKISYEVIPGVTAAFAAAAAMGMEYTLPEETQTLILTRISGRTPVPQAEDLDLLAAHKSSMAIYLSIAHVERVQATLARHYGEDALCAIAYKVGHPEQQIFHTPIHKLASTVDEKNIRSQALIIVGKSVGVAKDKLGLIYSKLYDSGFAHAFRAKTEKN